MSHSYANIWLHLVFATKNRQPLIIPEIEDQLYQHIKSELEGMGCLVKAVNGMPDHVHILFGLNTKLSVSHIVKQVKGSSAHWINKVLHQDPALKLLHVLYWQKGYSIFSVSEFHLDTVSRYIHRQKEHHKHLSFEDEFGQLQEGKLSP